MTLRLAALTLVAGAAAVEAAGHHRLSYYVLVAAVPFAAVAALAAFGAALERAARDPFERLGPALSALALPPLLLAAAARAPVAGDVPPRVAVTGLVASLVLLCLEAALAGLAPLVTAPRPALESD